MITVTAHQYIPSVQPSKPTYKLFHEINLLFHLRFRRSTHVTPKSYLSFIAGYKQIYSVKFGEINEMSQRMTTGLDKLVEASHSVAQLSEELAVKEKELAVASKEAEVVRVGI